MSAQIQAIFAYVQLGVNPSPILNFNAAVSARFLTNSITVLITDRPEEYSDFPGTLIKFDNRLSGDGFKRFMKNHRAYESVAGGYWRYTIERLFALAQLEQYFDLNYCVIHIESDVQTNIDSEILAALKAKYFKTAVPRYSKTEGIASILFSPSISVLVRDLKRLDQILGEDTKISSDMVLLGRALQKQTFDELPTDPVDALTIEKCQRFPQTTKVVFDGLAYGQYLFGQDPIHTGNRVVSGYENSHFRVKLSSAVWQIAKSDIGAVPQFRLGNDLFRVASLHVHSKILIDPSDTPRWHRAILEANGIIPRERGEFTPNLIHTKKVSILDRVRLVKQRGIIKSINRKIRSKKK